MSTTIIISIGIISICLMGIAIKILIKPNGQFSGTCASNNPFLNKEGEKCSYCGADPGDQCKKEENPDEK
ncbi:MAG: membrane or secreted protein [Flavobacteriales bacterium]|nr:membrane or secreted protein [Flavobacteriales bacterium]